MVQHLAAPALLCDHLQRLLTDGLEEHLGIKVALFCVQSPPNGVIEVLQLETALLGFQFASLLEDPFEDIRIVLIYLLVAFKC